VTSVNTNCGPYAAGCIFWGQGLGNWFIARNAITNYGLEGIQFNAGPAAAVGNVFDTFVSVFAACALNAFGGWPTVSGSWDDSVFSFVGNEVNGGRFGEKADLGLHPFHLHFTGNAVAVYPPFDLGGDHPGAVVEGGGIAFANVSGNRLLTGGHGIDWSNGATNAVVLKNDFAAAAYRGLSCDGTNGAVNAMAILKNDLGQGVSYHLRLRESDAGGFFLWGNHYTNGVTSVNPFTDSLGAPVHFIH